MEASSLANDEEMQTATPVAADADGGEAGDDATGGLSLAGGTMAGGTLLEGAYAEGGATLTGASFLGASPLGMTELSEDHSELVAQVVGDSGLLAPDKLEAVRTRAQGGSFSRALLDEGFAHSLGVARNLAEQSHLTLVDLAVEGVNAEAAKMVPLPVLDRVCAIPFAFDGKTLPLGITEPQNVQGLDELRLATRHSTEFSVAPREDVLTELRRLSRASEALNVALMDDAVAIARADESDSDLEADDGISDAPLVRL